MMLSIKVLVWFEIKKKKKREKKENKK